ncbi:hypothetical protein EON83_15765 [bacterium]|nr:MAG: hypothetical protein EON83_15765 [bacterium]
MLVVGACALTVGMGDARLLYQLFPAAIVVGLLIGLVVYAFRLKRLLISALSSRNRRAARADEFKFLDSPELERLTRQWEALGFVQCGEFTDGNDAQNSFTRLFEHGSEAAVVELTQQFLGAKALPLSSSVTSLWGDPEVRTHVEQLAQRLDEITDSTAPLASPSSASTAAPAPEVDELPLWLLITHNHAPNRYSPLFRQPRVIGARLPQNSSAADIWHAHLERSKLIEARLKKPLFRDELPLLIYAAGRVTSALIVKRLKATPLWKFIPYRFARDASVPTHHDGELAPLS